MSDMRPLKTNKKGDKGTGPFDTLYGPVPNGINISVSA